MNLLAVIINLLLTLLVVSILFFVKLVIMHPQRASINVARRRMKRTAKRRLKRSQMRWIRTAIAHGTRLTRADDDTYYAIFPNLSRAVIKPCEVGFWMAAIEVHKLSKDFTFAQQVKDCADFVAHLPKECVQALRRK